MSSVHKNLAEVPRTPTVTSRLPHLANTPSRSTTKIPLNNSSRLPVSHLKTPIHNTPTSRFLSSNKSVNSSINSPNRSGVMAPTKTPATPKNPIVNRGFNSARPSTNFQQKSFIPKTPSSAKFGLTSRLPAPTPQRKPSLLDNKKISRTLDCAKSIKRRSIKILNQSNRLSFLNEMESGCVLITPKLFKHLMNKNSNRVEQSIIEKDEAELLNEEDLKVRTIDPAKLFCLINEKKDEKKTETNNSIKVEIIVNVNPTTTNVEPKPVQVTFDTQQIKDELESKLKNAENSNAQFSDSFVSLKNNISTSNLTDTNDIEKIKKNDSAIEDNSSIDLEDDQKFTETIPFETQEDEKESIKVHVKDNVEVLEMINEEKFVESNKQVEERDCQVKEELNDKIVQLETKTKDNQPESIEIDRIEDKKNKNVEALDNKNEEAEKIVEENAYQVNEEINDRIHTETELNTEAISVGNEPESLSINVIEDAEHIQIVEEKEKKIEEQFEIEVANDVRKKIEIFSVEENYECKEISLQTEFNDDLDEKVDPKKRVDTVEDVKEIAVSKPKRGRKPKNKDNEENAEENDENEEIVKCTPVKTKRGRKPREEVAEEQETVKRVTRARAKLGIKN